MGLWSYLKGDGWATTRETDTTPPTPDIRTDVDAFEARYAEPSRTAEIREPTQHGHDRVLPHRPNEIDRLAHIVRQFQDLAGQMRTRTTTVREFHERATDLSTQTRQYPGDAQRWQQERHDAMPARPTTQELLQQFYGHDPAQYHRAVDQSQEREQGHER